MWLNSLFIMKISVAVLGSKVSVEVENGASASQALEVFERISGKVLKGMDVFKNGQKVEDLDALELQDNDELVAVKSKHESASVKISVKVLGNQFDIECDEEVGCSDALEVFERLTGKAMNGMDLYKNGAKLKENDVIGDGDEVVAIKSKHESAAVKITVKVLGSKFEVECDDDTECSDALETFERVTGKALKEMDLYRNGAKMTESDVLQDGDEVVAIKSKHESAV